VTPEESFEQLYRESYDAVRRFAVRRTDSGTGEEITAQTFLIAWRRRDMIPHPALPWLYGVARHVIANDRRAAGRRDRLLAALAAEREPAAPVGTDPTVFRALLELAEFDREALILTAWEGLTPSQAAQVAGCSATTMRVRLHRARRRYARRLSLEEPQAFGHLTLMEEA
jgi:RNA polymerase sigma factor (sigma-70 family)